MKPIRNKKITNSAKGEDCIRCGKSGETRACHYNGVRQLDFGKGRGQKCHDLMTAEFCHECDNDFREGTSLFLSKWDRSEEFLYWIAMTNIRRIEKGMIKIG